FADLQFGKEIDVFAGSSHEADAKEFDTRGITVAANKPPRSNMANRVEPPPASNQEMQDQAARKVYQTAVRRSLANADSKNLQLHFDVAVLEKYRNSAGYSILRTDTVGRVVSPGQWSLDFGIAPGEPLVHASAGDLQALPETERGYWASFALSLPVSRVFLQMRLSRGS